MSSHDHEPFHWRRSSIASGNNCLTWSAPRVIRRLLPAVSFKSLSDCKRLVLTSIFICFRTGWDDLVHMLRFHQLSSPWCLTNLRILYRPRKFKWPQELISKFSSYHRNHIIWLSSDDHGILVHMHHGISPQSMHHSDVKNPLIYPPSSEISFNPMLSRRPRIQHSFPSS